LSLCDMACSWTLLPPGQLRLLAGPEHGRTIPLAEVVPAGEQSLCRKNSVSQNI
jgi:hypothetical protein